MKKVTLLIYLFAFFSFSMYSQNYIFGETSTITTCTGVLFDNGGVDNYTNNQDITITIFPETAGQSVRLNFTLFDVEQYADNLFIYDGDAATDPLLTTLTGNIAGPFTVGATTNNQGNGALTLKFKSGNTVNAAGFQADIACYVPVNDPNFISFQGQANNTTVQYDLPCDAQTRRFYDSGGPFGIYSSNETRTITFSPQTAGQGVILDFEYIDIQSGGSDYLSFYDGPDATYPLITTLSGSYSNIQIGTSQLNNSGKLTVKFKSNISSNYAGWNATVQCYDAPNIVNMSNGSSTVVCGDDVVHFYDDGGVFNNYSNSITAGYTYVFTPSTSDKLKVVFESFKLENSNDRLYVYDGSSDTAPLLSVLSGTYTQPFTLWATNAAGSLTFKFKSNTTVNNEGWNAIITCDANPPQVDPSIITMQNTTTAPISVACGSTYTLFDSGGNIGYYNDGENYTMTLCPSDNTQTVYLDFTSFNLATGDVLEIYDGDSTTSSPFIGVFTGTSLPQGIAGTTLNATGCITLHFTSTTSGISTGWQAAVTCGPKLEKINMQNNDVTTCSALIFDSGGEFSNYQDDEDYTLTIRPATPGHMIRLDFSQFQIEEGSDDFYIYDGETATGTFFIQYSDNNIPPTVFTASDLDPNNTSGALTIKFVSDYSVTYLGWKAQASCIMLCQDINTEIVNVIPEPVLDDDTGEYISSICVGGTLSFSTNTTFSGSSAGAQYIWDFGDNSPLLTTTETTVTHSYSQAGGYEVKVIARDANNTTQECNDEDKFIVHVYPDPDFTGTQSAVNEICLGQEVVLTGVATPVAVEMDCTPPVAETTFLPDTPSGVVTAYSTCIPVGCFSASSTITSQNLIESVCLNMEHSYLGDLEINLISPNGQKVILKAYPGGSSANLGIPVATGAVDGGGGSNLTPGTGYTYCFKPDTSLPTMIEGIQTGGTFPSSSGGTYSDSYVPAGSYEPVEPFDGFIGSPLNGDWCIEIVDHLGIDNGFIFEWEINFDQNLTQSNFNFEPVITSQNWVNHPDIIATNENQITVKPTTIGEHCYLYQVTFDLDVCEPYYSEVCIIVNPLPDNSNIVDLHECSVSNNTASFDLQSVIDANEEFTTSIFLSEADANINENAITQLSNYNSGNATLYVRLENPTSGCVDVHPLHLIIDALPVANPVGNLTSCNRGNNSGIFNLSDQEDIIIGSQTGMVVSYHHSEVDAQNDTDPIGVTNFEEFNSGTKTLYVRIENASTGCFTTTSFSLTVQRCEPIVPNAFSPNGDNVNDLFTVENLKGVYPNFEFTLFNRWGNKVYTTNNSSAKYLNGISGPAIIWDGSVDGVISKDAEASTYYYILELNDDEHKPMTGWIYVNP